MKQRNSQALQWFILTRDPVADNFGSDAEAHSLRAHRPFRGDWTVPEIG